MKTSLLQTDCLIIVDIQNDFCPGGALGVPGGDEIIPVINAIMDKFSYKIASKDFHPCHTDHFKIWPVHCVAHTHGAEFHPDFHSEKIDKVFLKGTDDTSDGYSAFEATNEDLEASVKIRKIKRIFIAGLATDYCVRATALDALSRGFEIYIINDAVRAVDAKPGDGEKALNDVISKGGKIISSENIK